MQHFRSPESIIFRLLRSLQALPCNLLHSNSPSVNSANHQSPLDNTGNMFAYFGKFNFKKYDKDEMMVVLLPKGQVRAQDHVYIYTSWTQGGVGKVQGSWLNDLIVKKSTTSSNGEDTFLFDASYISWKAVSKDGYKRLQLTLSSPGDDPFTFTLDRQYQHDESYSPITEVVRVWTGKMDWSHYAVNEPFIVVAPQGLGSGKPILAFWQWTVDANGHKKGNKCTNAIQQSAKESAEKFSFTNYYTELHIR